MRKSRWRYPLWDRASYAWAGFITTLLICGSLNPAYADLSLETETARLLKPGGLEVSGAVEYQTSSTGHEVALPLAVEYGINRGLELLVEPVLYTAILPTSGRSARGLGDLELTLTHLVLSEEGARPAQS